MIIGKLSFINIYFVRALLVLLIVCNKIKFLHLVAIILSLELSICFAKEVDSPYNLLEHVKTFSKVDTSDKKESKKERKQIKKEGKDKISVLTKEGEIPNLDITIQQNINRTLISFPWKQPVATAVYKSSNYLWVIFDKKSSIKIDMLNDFMDKVVTTHTIVEDYLVPNIGDKASCIMLKLDGKTNADNHFLLSKRDHSIDLSISDYNVKTTNIDIISRPFDVVTPRLEFNIENLKNTSLISFVDPIVGDKIHALATNNVQYNIENAHSFIDLDIMKSIQGIVIREKSDNLQLNKSDVLFWITSKSGLNISSKYGIQKDISFFQKSGFSRLQQF